MFVTYARCIHNRGMNSSNVANLLGAFGLLLSDAVGSALADSGQEPASMTALVHLSKYPGENIDRLRGPLGLSHSGCVRLVDRIAAAGYVVRDKAPDGRSVAVRLTRKGRDAAAGSLRRRGDWLSRSLRSLSAEEQDTLGRLLAKVLSFEVSNASQALRVCRACDYRACTQCPVAETLRAAEPEA